MRKASTSGSAILLGALIVVVGSSLSLAPAPPARAGGRLAPGTCAAGDVRGAIAGDRAVPVTATTYRISAMSGGGGAIAPSGVIKVTQGGSQTFTLQAQPGYHILDLKVDGESLGEISSYTFQNVTSSHTIEAAFESEGLTFILQGGYQGQDFSTFLNIENPGSGFTGSEVTYQFSDGSSAVVNYPLPAKTRLSLYIDTLRGSRGIDSIGVSSKGGVIAECPVYLNHLDLQQSDCYPLATAEGLALVSPIRRQETMGIMFHQASKMDIHNLEARARPLIPFGMCLEDANPGGHPPNWSPLPNGDHYYWIEEPRGRGTYSTSAVDVAAVAGCEVMSPVDGVVESVEVYSLYGTTPDQRVAIIPNGRPDLRVVLVHLDNIEVVPGDEVRVGSTIVGRVAPLSHYFQSDIGRLYTGGGGDHAHLQVNLPFEKK